MEYLSDHIIAPRLSNLLTPEWSEKTTMATMWFVTALRVAAILDPLEREFGPRGIKKLFVRTPKQVEPDRTDREHDWSRGYYA